MAKFDLTPAQKAAVNETATPILVSAAAGSGKTKVLVERLIKRICDPENPCNVDDFLVITFTEKAAGELRVRILKELGERLKAAPEDRHLLSQLSRIYLAQISTIHAFCSNLLREYAHELDIPADFRQLSDNECAELREKVITALLERRYEQLDSDTAELIDTLGVGRNDRSIPVLLGKVYDTVQCHLRPEKWMDECLTGLVKEQSFAQSSWGQELLKNFRAELSLSEAWLEAALKLASEPDGLREKNIRLLQNELEAVQQRLSIDDWDALYRLGAPTYDSLRMSEKTEDEQLFAQVQVLRNAAKENTKEAMKVFSQPSAELLAELSMTVPAIRGLFALEREFAAAYRAEKLRLHAFDFNDLEHEAVRLLLTEEGKPSEIALEVSTRFKEVLMDEYQDTNALQDAICEAISKGNRFLVGDVKQSIYRFRLADPSIFSDKYRRYPDLAHAGASGPRKIFLSENFRSQAGVLDAVNAVFSVCMNEKLGGLRYEDEDHLRLGCAHTSPDYSKTELHCLESGSRKKEVVEAEFVAERIAQLLRDGTKVRGENEELRPVRAGDIVILLRSAARFAQMYLSALAKRGIPAMCDAGQSILETPEIESLISLLQTLDNVHQDIPLAAAMLTPLFGFTAQELAELRTAHRTGSLYEAVQAANTAKAAAFIKTLSELRIASRELPLHALLERIRQLTGYEGVCGAMPLGAERLRRLHRFDALASSFQAGGQRSLHSFLSYLETYKESEKSAQQSNVDAVRILTIHSSKGLEFPVVFLSTLSKGFNFMDFNEPLLLDPQLGAGSSIYNREQSFKYHSVAKRAITCKQKREVIAEELRILYVAMTRAKDLLVMSYCEKNIEKKLQDFSAQLVFPLPEQFSTQAKNSGYWVLLAAALRSEASELFYDRPYPTQSSEQPWRITLHQQLPSAPESSSASSAAVALEAADPEEVKRALSFTYPQAALAGIPSKITATQLKGRQLDEEVSTGSVAPIRLNEPTFLAGEQPLSPTERGTAVHLAMQFLDFSKAGSIAQLRGELERMVSQELLTKKQAACVEPEKLLRAFTGELGALLKGAVRVIREFKFSTLTDASAYFAEAADESLLLQGVVDCCIVEPDGLSVVDFKTDKVFLGHEAERAEHYRGQLEAYSLALSEIYGLPVKRKLLYFFATDTLFAL